VALSFAWTGPFLSARLAEAAEKGPAVRQKAPARPRPPRPAIGNRDQDSTARYHAELARVHARYGHHEDAAAEYRKAIEAEEDPDRKSIYRLELANGLCETGQTDEALKIATGLIEGATGRQAVQAQLLIAEIYERKDQVDEAIAAYEKVVAAAESEFQRRSAQSRLLNLLAKSDRLDEVIARYETRLQEDPKDETARRQLIEIYTRYKPEAKKAIALLEKAAEAQPGDADLQRRLAMAYQNAGQPDKAINVYETLAAADPDRKAYYYERAASIEARRENPEAALLWAERIVKEGEQSASAYARYASVCEQIGRHKEALEAYAMAARKSGNAQLRDHYRLRAASCARMGKLPKKAEALLRQLSEHGESASIRAQAKRQLFELLEQQDRLDEIRFPGGEPAGGAEDAPKAPAEKGKNENKK
jgi:tetratricopeptide (TPR) repeat protein